MEPLKNIPLQNIIFNNINCRVYPNRFIIQLINPLEIIQGFEIWESDNPPPLPDKKYKSKGTQTDFERYRKHGIRV